MINNILNIQSNNYLWLYFLRKLSRFYKIYFVPTIKKRLPKNNHPTGDLKKDFEIQLSNYETKNFSANFDLYKILKKYFKKNSKIRLLDYGGENLDLYLFLKGKFSNIKIFIINQPKVNKILKKIILKKKIENLTVVNNVRQLNVKSLNFINFGSSLQYIDDYENILLHLFKGFKGFFYLKASSFFFKISSKKNIVAKQVNLLPTILYCYIFNFKYIKSLFYNNKFFILLKKNNSFKKVNFKNFNMNIKYLDILFFRK